MARGRAPINPGGCLGPSSGAATGDGMDICNPFPLPNDGRGLGMGRILRHPRTGQKEKKQIVAKPLFQPLHYSENTPGVRTKGNPPGGSKFR